MLIWSTILCETIQEPSHAPQLEEKGGNDMVLNKKAGPI
jgi:hypothetical protein